MKKFIINLLLVLTFILIYLLHSNFFMGFRIVGVMPNLFVIFILFIGLYANKTMGPLYGVICGLLLDSFIGERLGINAIMLGIIGLIGVIFDRNFSKENRITLIIMIIISTIIFEMGCYVLTSIINKTNMDMVTFIQILLIECVYNSIMTLILYPLIKILGNKIEAEYKGNKILTRYF